MEEQIKHSLRFYDPQTKDYYEYWVKDVEVIRETISFTDIETGERVTKHTRNLQ